MHSEFHGPEGKTVLRTKIVKLENTKNGEQKKLNLSSSVFVLFFHIPCLFLSSSQPNEHSFCMAALNFHF